ncbi:calpain-5-like [Patiria miniata]|uniref:Calpain-5-like n=1 Tax=Patiria miniata TaxID=46514 RepID=A0A913ZG90_PATMI|nr:calpain-5-like [Patiria miniata]
MTKVVPYKGQRYADIVKRCVTGGTLWEDPEFPATDASLFNQRNSPGRIEWKRPKDICPNPHLVVEGTSTGDVSQGQLGNCWFVASCANLAQEKELWEKVVPDNKEQDWDDENPEKHSGAFHFRFWRFNKWLDVVIDDRLPTNNNKLIYVHSTDRNEFWSALLEKAYAKLSGCYENLDGGNTADALVDFTGGVAESISLTDEKYMQDFEKKKEFHKNLKKYSDRKFLMSASIKVTSAEEMEAKTDVGLVKGHAYGVTAVKTVKLGAAGLLSLFNTEKAHLVRLRNPWGEKEWNGPWSDGSPEWQKVSESQRKSLGITFDDDGEFWMPFDDFCTNFTNLVICRMPNKSFLSIQRTWHEKVMISAWKKGPGKANRAGGCINNRETFLQNPQFMISVDSDEDDIILCLTQPDLRSDKKENKTIGFNVMKVEDNRKYRLHTPGQKVINSTFINSRSVFEKCTLKRGRYVVLATTFDQGEEGPLMMRIFSDEGAKCWELVKEAPSRTMMSNIRGYPQVVSKITVLSATGLQKQDHFGGGADPYVYLKWDNQTTRSPVIKNTLNPEFNFSALIYRKKPQNPIIVEIWNSNVVKDQFMGAAVFMAPVENAPKQYTSPLHGRGRNTDETRSGSVSVVVHTTNDLEAF